jgi:hypothetical protein
MTLAITSLPVPLSPVRRIMMFSGAIRLTVSSMVIMAGERKTPNSSSAASAVSDRASSADDPPRRRAGLSTDTSILWTLLLKSGAQTLVPRTLACFPPTCWVPEKETMVPSMV